MRVLLVRHAESTGQQPEAGLTERGHARSAEMAAALCSMDIRRVVTSPYRRARETAAHLATADLVVDERLVEWDVPWIAPADWPAALRPWLTGEAAVPPPYEPLAAARSRGLAAVAEAAAQPHTTALVGHGKLLALTVGALQHTDPFAIFRTLGNPHVLELVGGADGAPVTTRRLWPPET